MKKVVIKIGSGTLLTKRGKLDEFRLAHVAEQIKTLHKNNCGVVLVVSGAVACGVAHVSSKQAAAGIGQVAMISALQKVFKAKGLLVAQILLTAGALESAGQRGKLCEVLGAYLEAGVVAVANENDVVDLNGFGGNDLLAVETARLVGADQVLILSQMARSMHSVGGGETKLEALKVLEQEGIKASIINGKDKNGILKNII